MNVFNPFSSVKASAETDCIAWAGLLIPDFYGNKTYPFLECNWLVLPEQVVYSEGVFKFGGNPNYALDHDDEGNIFLSEFTNKSSQKWQFGLIQEIHSTSFRSNDNRCITFEGAELIQYGTYEPSMPFGKKLKLIDCNLFPDTGLITATGLNDTSSISSIMYEGFENTSDENDLKYIDYLNCMKVDATDYKYLSGKPIVFGSCTIDYNLAETPRTATIYDNCFNFFSTFVFDRTTQAQIEYDRQGYSCDSIFPNNGNQDLDEFDYGNNNDSEATMDVIPEAVQDTPEPNVWELAKQASTRTINDFQQILDGTNTCGTWDIGCYSTNSVYQSSAITMANTIGKLLFGMYSGFGSTLALDVIVKAILASAFKIVAIFISIIGLIAGAVALFQNLGPMLQSYINLPVEDKAFSIGNIIGVILGVVVLGGPIGGALDNIAQTMGNAINGATKIGLKATGATLEATTKILSGVGMKVYDQAGRAVIKARDFIKLIRTGGKAAFDKYKGYFYGSEKYAGLANAVGSILKRDSLTIRYSQSTISKEFSTLGGGGLVDYLTVQLVSGVKNADTINPITIFKMPDGIFTSLDNRRLFAFQKANKPIATIEKSLDDLLTPDLIARYSKKGFPEPKTYRDAIDIRIKSQNNSLDGTKFSTKYPNGSFEFPRINN